MKKNKIQESGQCYNNDVDMFEPDDMMVSDCNHDEMIDRFEQDEIADEYYQDYYKTAPSISENKKQLIRLTESDLYHIIKETINSFIKEDIMNNNYEDDEEKSDSMKNFFNDSEEL